MRYGSLKRVEIQITRNHADLLVLLENLNETATDQVTELAQYDRDAPFQGIPR
jgi:hypothetical protein